MIFFPYALCDLLNLSMSLIISTCNKLQQDKMVERLIRAHLDAGGPRPIPQGLFCSLQRVRGFQKFHCHAIAIATAIQAQLEGQC